MVNNVYRFYEFFAGGGMARAGFGDHSWECVFSNDFDHKKGKTYQDNWGCDTLKIEDVGKLKSSDLPGVADLVWASFPCQDLSLAGGGAGLKGERSGTFWPFWHLMKALIAEGRAPSIIALENVCGTLSSHEGKDFASICDAFGEVGYRFGAVVVDAAHFVPQSRPRLFMIGVHADVVVPDGVAGHGPSALWHTKSVRSAFERLSLAAQKNWIWWRMAAPEIVDQRFADLIEDEPPSVEWHSAEKTAEVLAMMSSVNLAKVEKAKEVGTRMVGTIYRRTRHDENGIKVQRTEVRFDDIAGCLRTPAGGSSRQMILVVDGQSVKSRLISSRETARLMGLKDSYILPSNYNESYHLMGDGVVAPVVRHLASTLFEPVLASTKCHLRIAA